MTAREELDRLIYDAGTASGAGTIDVDGITDALLASPDVVLRALGREPLQEAHCDCCDYYGMDD